MRAAFGTDGPGARRERFRGGRRWTAPARVRSRVGMAPRTTASSSASSPSSSRSRSPPTSFLTGRTSSTSSTSGPRWGSWPARPTLVIIAGGFDLSVGAIFAVAGITAAKVANATSPESASSPASASPSGSASATASCHGRAHQPVRRDAGLELHDPRLRPGPLRADSSSPSPTRASSGSGSGELLGVTYPVYLFAGFVALAAFLLAWTTFGRYVYSAGANPAAARLSGVRVDGVRAATFALSGLSAGLAGIIVSSRAATGQADAGIGLEFSVHRRRHHRRDERLRRRGRDLAHVLGVLFLG